MLQKQIAQSGVAKGDGLAITSIEGVLTFDAGSAVRGIVFHLLDEKLARRVPEDAIKRTTDRLSGRDFRPSIARSRWTQMTNPQRLEWLLTETQTTTFAAPNDTVLLRARKPKS